MNVAVRHGGGCNGRRRSDIELQNMGSSSARLKAVAIENEFVQESH
jgi:hypothetical protein